MNKLLNILKDNPDDLLDYSKYQSVYPFWYNMSNQKVDELVSKHTIEVVKKVSKKDSLLLAAFLHDCGRPDSKRVSCGKAIYTGHAILGGMIAQKILNELGMDQDLIKRVVYLIMHHDDLIEKIYDQDVLELILADTLAQKHVNFEKVEKIRKRQKEFKIYEN